MHTSFNVDSFSISALKAIMADDPLRAFVCAPQLLTCEEEQAPSMEPLRRFVLPIGTLKHWQHLSLLAIEIVKPTLAGQVVVLTIDMPVVVDAHVAREEVKYEGVAGHGAAREEIPGHPAACAAVVMEVVRHA